MMRIHAGMFSDIDQACESLAAAKSHKTDRDNRFSLREIVAAGVPVRLVGEGGDTIGGYVVKPYGRALWITAAAGRADLPLCPIIDHHATEQARRGGYEAIGFRTERAGLVERAARLGYELVRLDGRTYYMRKSIK